MACLLAIAGTELYGQASNFSIGPRAGINIATVSNLDNIKAAIGPVFGLTSTYSFAESSGVTLDILYSQEGYKVDNGPQIKLNYIQVPVYFDLFFGKLGEAFRPKVYVGVAPGFFLSGKSDDTEISDGYTSVIVSLTGGLGFNYRIADRVWLNADLRSYLGLSDIRDKAYQNGDKIAGRNVQLSAGVAFGLN
jgi:outer membrane protein W